MPTYGGGTYGGSSYWGSSFVWPTPPAPTLSVTASRVAALLTWTSVPAASSFKVERSPDDATWAQIASGVTPDAYNDGATSPGNVFWYRVRATGYGGDGPYSNSASVAMSGLDQSMVLYAYENVGLKIQPVLEIPAVIYAYVDVLAGGGAIPPLRIGARDDAQPLGSGCRIPVKATSVQNSVRILGPGSYV